MMKYNLLNIVVNNIGIIHNTILLNITLIDVYYM